MASKFSDSFTSWYDYAERFKDRPPRPLLTRAVEHVVTKGRAIDLGSGGLNDSRYLLDIGFEHVVALDGEPIAQAVADALPEQRFTYVISSFEAARFEPESFDLVSAQYALPFIRPGAFNAVYAGIKGMLVPGGVFTGQFFGDGDDWVGTPNMSFHSKAEALQLLDGLELIEFTEEDDPASSTLSGKAKHWHLFHFIARKPQ